MLFGLRVNATQVGGQKTLSSGALVLPKDQSNILRSALATCLPQNQKTTKSVMDPTPVTPGDIQGSDTPPSLEP